MTTERMPLKSEFHVCIFGGGISGLFSAIKLLNFGYSVILVEAGDKLASGASTRNEGWLHNGTYHCGSIVERHNALQVARRCISGYEEIHSYAPEVIENPELSSYALIKNENLIDEVLGRWDETEIPYEPVSKAEIYNCMPRIIDGSFSAAFKVKDVSINTRMLYKKMYHEILRKEGFIVRGAQVKFLDSNRSEFFVSDKSGQGTVIKAGIYLHAMGYHTKRYFKEQFDIELPLRLWKSHLLTMPKISDNVCFFLDPGEVTIMRHGPNSVIGFNEDAKLCEDFSLNQFDQEEVNRNLVSLRRVFNLDNIESYHITSCIKVDVFETLDNSRSLDFSILEVLKNHMCIFPGKMTLAPCLANEVVKRIYSRLDDDVVSFRPWDVGVAQKL